MSNKINESLPVDKRVGQVGVNNQGEKMTIIAYRRNRDIDIQFEDEIIVEHRDYDSFLKGKIKHPIRYEQSFAYHIEVELELDINKIWNFEKNTVSPYEIYKSGTEKVWLYCLEKDYHNDEGGYKIQCNSFYRGSRCGYCNSFASHKVHKLDSLGHLYPQIAQMIVDDERNNVTMEDMYKITPQSDKKFYFKCDKCDNGSSSKKQLQNVTIRGGYSCEHCSDGLSTSEKFMINVLKQLDIEFVTQLSKSTFEWCQDYKYDFYIPYFGIIETHGEQHYNGGFESCKGRTLEDEQLNDELKKNLALENNIENYIIIDCRYSQFEWLKKNTIKELNDYFDLSNVDWSLVWENSLKSLVWEVKRLYELGYTNKEMSKEIGVCEHTIIEYKKKLGIKTASEKKQENLQKVKEMLELNYSNKEICEELKIATITLYKYKKELNL